VKFWSKGGTPLGGGTGDASWKRTYGGKKRERTTPVGVSVDRVFAGGSGTKENLSEGGVPGPLKTIGGGVKSRRSTVQNGDTSRTTLTQRKFLRDARGKENAHARTKGKKN